MVKVLNDKLLRNDPCFCGSGKKYKRCHSDVHPDSRAANLIKQYRDIENKTKDYQESTGHMPPCHKGCFNCCYDDFAISEVEFELIMREMKTWKQEDVEAAFNRALDQCEYMKRYAPHVWNNLQDHSQSDVSIIDKQRFYQRTRIRNRFPCPMLNEEKQSCMVYNERPAICRMFGSSHITSQITTSKNVCELIPDSTKLAYTTPNVDETWESILSFVSNHKMPNGMPVPLREYPIYYWFHILYNRTGKKEAQYNHYDNPINFDRPINQSDYQILKGYGAF